MSAKFNYGILLLFIGTALLFNGYHYADLGQNIRWFNAEYETNLNDRSLLGYELDPIQMYSIGMIQMRISIGVMFFAGVLIGRCRCQ